MGMTAENIAEKTRATIHEIGLTDSYTVPSVYWKSKKQLKSGNYPTISNLPNVNDYDVVFVGAPVWWFTLNPVLFSLLKEVDFKNKHVVLFSTQQSNKGNFYDKFKENVKNARVVDYMDFDNVNKSFDRQVNNKITTWLNAVDDLISLENK